MKSLIYIFLFLIVFGISFYFFLLNSSQSVVINLWKDVKTPELPIGMVVLVSFFLGFVLGMIFFPLTYVIKKVSS